MRRLRRDKNRLQIKVLLGGMICLLLIMTVGYAAFSTNITLNAKGNLVECYLNRKWDFDYKNQAQEFTASCSGTYKIELWGAGNTLAGGGYTKGELELTNNDKFYIYVGEKGHDINSDTKGGYNGGGDSSATTLGKSGATGSGATDIRTVSGEWNDFASLKSRIMVAGGAGGVVNGEAFVGSNSGGLTGYDGSNANATYLQYLGKGAGQISGGLQPTKYSAAQSNGSEGLFGKGGTGGMSKADAQTGGGSGGGSGYFGGSGASGLANGTFSSGGGSSFISGHTGCIAITDDSTENVIKQRTGTNNISCVDNPNNELCSHHYSNYVFSETVMIDGAGYEWTTMKGDYVGQLQPDGTTKAGNQDNGHARITLISLN